MYEQIGYSVADVVAKAVFGRADLGHRREFVSWCIWEKTQQSVLSGLKHLRTHEYVGRLLVDAVD